MKKLILSLFLSIIGFIGFSNAGTLGDYSLSYRGVVNVNVSPGYSYEVIPLDNIMSDENSLRLTCYTRYNEIKAYCGKGCSFDTDSLLNAGCSLDSINLTCYESPCNFKIDFVSPPPPPVVEGGSSNITPVITGLFGVYGELIPYVVYIGIGVLIVTLGFYAIRRLVNWLSDKIHNNFKF